MSTAGSTLLLLNALEAPYLVAAVALGVNPTNAARAPETPGTATAVRRIVSAILSGNITNNHLGKNEY